MEKTHQKYSILLKIIPYLTISLASFNSFAAEASVTALSSKFPPTWEQLGLMEGFPPSETKLVTKVNYRKPPFNRWAFQHMRYLNFTAPVERGTTGVSQFEAQPQDFMNKKFTINKQVQTLGDF